MTLSRDGIREMLVCTLLFGGGGLVCALAAWKSSIWWAVPACILFALWIFTLAFFRDPLRVIPQEKNVFVSPADGKVTEVSRIDNVPELGGPGLRISIFLSVFDVHINRSPCGGRVLSTQYKKGLFLDARHVDCGTRNENNTIVIQPNEDLPGPVVVRQIAGLIARRIICHAGPGTMLARGQHIGMIKFGSRTDLVVPMREGLEAAVHVNDVVKGGSTILMRIQEQAQPIRKESGEAKTSVRA